VKDLKRLLKVEAAERGVTLTELLAQVGTSTAQLWRACEAGQTSTAWLARVAALAGCEVQLVRGGEVLHVFNASDPSTDGC